MTITNSIYPVWLNIDQVVTPDDRERIGELNKACRELLEHVARFVTEWAPFMYDIERDTYEAFDGTYGFEHLSDGPGEMAQAVQAMIWYTAAKEKLNVAKGLLALTDGDHARWSNFEELCEANTTSETQTRAVSILSTLRRAMSQRREERLGAVPKSRLLRRGPIGPSLCAALTFGWGPLRGLGEDQSHANEDRNEQRHTHHDASEARVVARRVVLRLTVAFNAA